MRPQGPAYPRLAATSIILATLAGLLLLRVGYLTLSERAALAASQTAYADPIEAGRGSLWDRNGAVLATDTLRFDAGLNTAGMDDARLGAVAAAVGPRFGLDPGEVLRRGELARTEHDVDWVSLRFGLSLEETQALREAKAGGDPGLRGVEFSQRLDRAYPLGADAMAVLGIVMEAPVEDGASSERRWVGSHGVEAQYRDQLDGLPGQGAGIRGSMARGFRPPRPGMDLRLTLDRGLQIAAADALRRSLAEQDATAGTVIVLDTATGAVLASVSEPSFDPNVMASADPSRMTDPASAAYYEPGSVMKIFTMAAGLDSGAIQAGSHYQDDGVVDYAGMTIHNWDRLAHGWTSMTKLLEDSLNVGAVWVATQTGEEAFYAELADFGFGQPTGIDLPGELPGVLHRPGDADWYDGFLATNSYGHSIDATPLQVTAAVNAVANDGLLMRPYLVAERIPAEGPSLGTSPHALRQVIRPDTARTLRRMLQSVVDNHATNAAVPGYSVGGKTGTTEVIDPVTGQYHDEETIASFCGFLPVERPVVTICAKVDRPSGQRGAEVAAPLFRDVAIAAIAALDIPMDRAVVETAEGEVR